MVPAAGASFFPKLLNHQLFVKEADNSMRPSSNRISDTSNAVKWPKKISEATTYWTRTDIEAQAASDAQIIIYPVMLKAFLITDHTDRVLELTPAKIIVTHNTDILNLMIFSGNSSCILPVAGDNMNNVFFS